MNAEARQPRKPDDILKRLDCIIEGKESLPIEIDIEEITNIRYALHEAIRKKEKAQLEWIKSVREVYEICAKVERIVFGYQDKKKTL